MAAKIQKWGNSLGIRIPKQIIEKAKLGEGSMVEIEYRNGEIVISPVRNSYSLDALLKDITKENLQSEDVTSPRGKEVW